MDVSSIRSQIPATRSSIYMNTGWSGPSPEPVTRAIIEGLEMESRQGPTARPVLEWHLAVRNQVRQAIATLLGVDAEEIALTQNTTEGLNLVVNGLSFSPGDVVITCAPEYPTVIIPCYYLRERHAVELRFVPLARDDSRESLLNKFADALGHGRVRLIFFSHISYANGMRLPLREICDLAHERGALVLVDGAQAAGHTYLDLRQVGADFYAMPGHKWLLGPGGVGALYVCREHIERLETVKTGFISAASYDFAGQFQPRRDDIRKFELTTTSIPLWAGLVAALEFFESVGGVVETERRLLSLAALMRHRLREIPGVTVLSPDGELASGLIVFAVAGCDAQEVTARLWEQGRVICRTLQVLSATRLSVAFFNTEEEVQQVADLVRELAEKAPAGNVHPATDIERRAITEL